jgi:hypothetical protein
VIHDEVVTDRLNKISSTILAQLPPTQLKWRIVLIDMPVVDSFSNGAGRIYMTRKMIAFLHNDDALAGLIGHEIGHILTHQNAILTTQMFHDILGVDSVGDRKDIFEKYNRMVDNFGRNRGVAEKTIERVRKEEEPHQYVADQVAVYTTAAAGYSPKAFAEFLDRLAQTHGKTGTALSDLFGTTKPNEKRMKELQKTMSSLPQPCRDIVAAAPTADFLAWQADVVAHSGYSQRESVVGVISKKALEPPLRTDMRNVKFSPIGDYSLAQDDSSIYVFENDPFHFVFRIDAPEAHNAQFSPDSKKILFLTQGLRVEEWDVDDAEQSNVHEIALQEGCLADTISNDGKLLACVNSHLDLQMLDVASGEPVLTEKEFFEPKNYGVRGEQLRFLLYFYAETGYGGWLRMQFSPDDAYFAATGMGLAAAVNVADRSKISLHGELN